MVETVAKHYVLNYWYLYEFPHGFSWKFSWKSFSRNWSSLTACFVRKHFKAQKVNMF